MAEEPESEAGLSEHHPRASPWPLFVALGLVFSEVGVFLDVFPVAVGGVVLLGASVAGILRESGYAARTWLTLVALGVAFGLLGAAVVATQVSPAVSFRAVLGDPNGVVGRGVAVVVAGVALLAAGVTVRLLGPQRE